jgi:hypothetical protein
MGLARDESIHLQGIAVTRVEAQHVRDRDTVQMRARSPGRQESAINEFVDRLATELPPSTELRHACSAAAFHRRRVSGAPIREYGAAARFVASLQNEVNESERFSPWKLPRLDREFDLWPNLLFSRSCDRQTARRNTKAASCSSE